MHVCVHFVGVMIGIVNRCKLNKLIWDIVEYFMTFNFFFLTTCIIKT